MPGCMSGASLELDWFRIIWLLVCVCVDIKKIYFKLVKKKNALIFNFLKTKAQ